MELSRAAIFIEQALVKFPSIEIYPVSNENLNADFVLIDNENVSDISDEKTAVIERGSLNNIIFFRGDIEYKLSQNNHLTIATAVQTNTAFVQRFLQKALPNISRNPISISFLTEQTDLEKLLVEFTENLYDGLLIPLADVVSLLKYSPAKQTINDVLKQKKYMMLPLFECPPVAAQSAFIVAASANNATALSIVHALNNAVSKTAIQKELHQEFYPPQQLEQLGIFHLDTAYTSFTYALGINGNNEELVHWDFEMDLDIEGKNLFASTDFMKDFFSYRFIENTTIDKNVKAVFIASHKAIHTQDLIDQISAKSVWAAGSRTWYDLAKKGIWVNGCADGLGLETLSSIFSSPVVNLSKENMQIVTNTSGCGHWNIEGWKTLGTYELEDTHSGQIADKIAKADIVFWSSFQQYQSYKKYIREKTIHLSPAGKTAKLLFAEGLQPITFPTIKAFNDWRKNNHFIIN